MNSDRILRLPDSYIQELGTRGEYTDYRIGRSVTVSYRGGGRYLCLSCKWPNNYQLHDRKGCAHIQRVQRFREEHMEALNVPMADPALSLGGVVG